MYSLNREYLPPLTAPSVVPTSQISELNSEDEFGPDKRGHKGTERKCVATGKVEDTAKMVRFVMSPDGEVVPDIAGKLPGRGVWVTAHREPLTKAIKTGGFARGFKSKVKVDAWRIEAREGAADGRSKIRTLSKAVAMELDMAVPKAMGCFTGAELAEALGRDTVVHVALPPGRLAKAFSADAARYRGFRQLIPREWEDISHEIKMPKPDGAAKKKESGKRP